jgi:signal transduction histidine kinase
MNILKMMPLIILLAFIESILLFLFTLLMFIKRKKGSTLFFIAHLLYIVSILVYILNLSGQESNPMTSIFLTSFGVFFAITFMSLSINSKIKLLKNEHDNLKLEMEKNKQFTLIGTTISYVTHQWKQPLSKLSSLVMKMQALADQKPLERIIVIKDDIDKMQNDIKFVNNTLSDIKSLFKLNKGNKNTFEIGNSIEGIKNDFKKLLLLENVNITINIQRKKEIHGIERLFMHAISNIINNSLDAIQDKKISSGFIKFYDSEDTNVLFIIEDNAQGIDKIKINSIFEIKKSTKNNGMGIGLHITKEILQKEFNIKISVENIDNGTRFILKNIKC